MTFQDSRVRPSFLSVWTTLKARVGHSLRKRGFVGTVALAAVIVRTFVRCRLMWPYLDVLNKAFDRRFGVDTAGILILPEHESDPRFKHAYHYHPTSRSRFFRMLRWLDVDYRRFVFIDFGCGKGKALLLASELPFKQIIGIELSSALIGVAKENLTRYSRRKLRCTTVNLVCLDAADYPIPHEPAIYYFYNPFEAEVMHKMLENIRASLAEAPREAYVIYLGPQPEHQRLLDESGFYAPIKRTSWCSIYRVSGAEVALMDHER